MCELSGWDDHFLLEDTIERFTEAEIFELENRENKKYAKYCVIISVPPMKCDNLMEHRPLSRESKTGTEYIKHFEYRGICSVSIPAYCAYQEKECEKSFIKGEEMYAIKGKVFLLGIVFCISGIEVNCILTKTTPTPENNDLDKTDNAAEQSIKRDYIAGLEESGYNHDGYGLGGHASYGFPEGGHDSYGALEGGKHFVHYPEDHQQHHHHHHQDHHKHYDLGYHKALAIKSLLVPLAGVALLGAAAAFVSNPILLQLGVISGSSLGRRKRRAIPEGFQGTASREDRIRLNEIKLLERFMAEVPDQSIRAQEKKMVANYLSCSAAPRKNLCLERLVCELHSEEGTSMAMEANVLTIALNEILGNEFVADDTKIRLKEATERGRRNAGCGVYQCEELEKWKSVVPR